MQFDKPLVAGKLRRWEKYLIDYRLPEWNEIPDIGLYMEQVIEVLKKYLDYLPPELKDENFITAATINNYVRKGFMPKPENKRYYRTHMAYLIIICSLKQSLSIPTLKTIIPVDLSEEELKNTYTAYVYRHQVSCKYFAEQIRIVAGGILDHPDTDSILSIDSTVDLITASATISGFAKILAEKLLLLEGKNLENGGSIEIIEREK